MHPGDRFTSGRLALTIALLALPDHDAFFALDDLEEALFARIGERFSLGHEPHPPYTFDKDPEKCAGPSKSGASGCARSGSRSSGPGSRRR